MIKVQQTELPSSDKDEEEEEKEEREKDEKKMFDSAFIKQHNEIKSFVSVNLENLIFYSQEENKKPQELRSQTSLPIELLAFKRFSHIPNSILIEFPDFDATFSSSSSSSSSSSTDSVVRSK